MRVTKRRPSWSKGWRWVAALAGGLLLLNSSSTDWATSQQPSAKPAAQKKAIKPVNRTVRRSASTDDGIVQAEIMDDAVTGLHGHASFYGHGFQGRKTSTGERFDVQLFTAASNRFPLGTMVAVRRLDNDRCAIVKVNDRMHPKHRKRVIDVSRGVAEYLDMIRAGVVLVRVAVLRADWRERGAAACQAAFELESACPNCSREPRLPDFIDSGGG